MSNVDFDLHIDWSDNTYPSTISAEPYLRWSWNSLWTLYHYDLGAAEEMRIPNQLLLGKREDKRFWNWKYRAKEL